MARTRAKAADTGDLPDSVKELPCGRTGGNVDNFRKSEMQCGWDRLYLANGYGIRFTQEKDDQILAES